ncbi:MAG: outer membrane lipoprotein-sorting protein [Candidatus Muiribacteriaceae bacterium]
MKKIMILWFVVIMIISVYSEKMGITEMLDKIDHNQTPDSMTYHGEMIIHRGSRESVKKYTIQSRGSEKAYIEFTYPPRDAGTKYLRMDDNLWMYLPGAQRTVKISGHMLRQSMMGSDFSYDDETDNAKLKNQYNGDFIEYPDDTGEIVIMLTANEGRDTTYYQQKLWVDRDKMVIRKAEMYGRSGKLLKEMRCEDFRDLNGRFYPHKIIMEDKLKNNSFTEVIVKNVRLDVSIPDRVFSLRNLERK